ncbi:MAG: DUF4388 domain-containing protein [Deltaproteobacteria bacterium]|nr:MAG: DUF4388 domain-containing protein [Deltaproteobacteria bacterium]
MSVGLRGVLKDFGIAEVFQLIGQQRKTGVLELERRDRRVSLQFDSGAVLSAAPAGAFPDEALGEMLVRCGLLTRARFDELAKQRKTSLQTLRRMIVERKVLAAAQIEEIEDLLTRETIFDVLRWTDGSFRFTAQAVSHDREAPHLIPAEQILMDGLRMADEWRTFADEIPSEETVFQRCGRFEIFRDSPQADSAGSPAQAEAVFRLVDGRLSARRVMDLSRLGTFDGARILSALRRAGVIEPIDPRRVPKRAKVRDPRSSAPMPVRSWIATLLPFGLLLALAFSDLAGGWIGGPRADAASFRIDRSPLAAARVAFETDRVRRALETYRFMTGAWPVELGELVDRGLLEPGALTPANGRPYYYAHRGEEVLLLAPEY